eukprot:10488200-Alexandrium_andersonii.AAC.1
MPDSLGGRGRAPSTGSLGPPRSRPPGALTLGKRASAERLGALFRGASRCWGRGRLPENRPSPPLERC